MANDQVPESKSRRNGEWFHLPKYAVRMAKKFSQISIFQRSRKMNKQTTKRNYRRLIDYDQLGGQSENQQPPGQERSASNGTNVKKKLTLVLDLSYIDVLTRLKILEGTTMTEIVRRAVDAYADQFGDDVLFPASGK